MEQILAKSLGLIPIICFAVFGVLFIVLVVATLYYGKKDRDELKPLAASLGGEYVVTKINSYISLPDFGPDARLELDDGGGDFPAYVLLSMPVAHKFDLDITRKGHSEKAPSSDGRLDKNMRAKAVKADFSVEDSAFEQQYQVLCSDVDSAKSFLLASDKRALLEKLFAAGFTWLRMENGFVFLQKLRYTASDLAPDKVMYSMDQLKHFAG